MMVSVGSIGVAAPGLVGWTHAQRVLSGDRSYVADEMPNFVPDILRGNERRRSTTTIRLALQVAEEAVASAGVDPANLRSVFACSGGDTEALDGICSALASPGRPVSPGQFNNSVHNAPAGYWAIATGSHLSSTSLGAYDASFAAGLLDAATVVLANREAVLLVAYDTPSPPALLPFRPLVAPFATAMVLTPEDGPTAHRLSLQIATGRDEDRLPDPDLEHLRTGNPAARSLPLLARIASGQEGETVLPYLPGSQIVLDVRP